MCYLFSLVSFQHLHQGPMCKTGWPPFSCTPMYYQSPHWLIPPPIPSSSPIPSLVSSPQSVLSEYPNSETLPHPPRLKQDPSICNPGHATAHGTQHPHEWSQPACPDSSSTSSTAPYLSWPISFITCSVSSVISGPPSPPHFLWLENHPPPLYWANSQPLWCIHLGIFSSKRLP